MVVNEDRSCRGHAHEWPEHFARMHFDGVYRASRDLDDIEQPVSNVDSERKKYFLLHAGDPRANDAKDVFGCADHVSSLFGLERSSSEFERRSDPRRSRATDPRNLYELMQRGARYRRDSATCAYQIGGNRPRWTRPHAAAKHDRKQLFIANRCEPASPKSFAWTVV